MLNDFGGERAILRSPPEKITSGCPFLDKFLRGGLTVGGLTEIFGEAGSGKTQFCMQLALTVQLSSRVSGLAAGAVYLTTGNLFPSKRFAELCSLYIEKYGDYILPKPMNNVILEHFQDINSLMECITTRLPIMIERSKARLLIIDSIAPIFRADFDNNLESQVQKSKLLRKIAMCLRKITRDYKTVVVVTNQVTSSISKGKEVAALGLNWSNCVTTRIQLLRQVNEYNGELDRIFQIIFSPRLKPEKITFEITENGIKITEKDCGIFF